MVQKAFILQTKFTHTSSTIIRNRVIENTSCFSCENNDCLIKRNLTAFENSDMLNEKSNLRCKRGQQFIMEGAPVNGLFFVLKGKVKVFRTGINGREQIVRFAKEGEIIGHRGFGTEESYSIGAIALEDTRLCYFSKQSTYFNYSM